MVPQVDDLVTRYETSLRGLAHSLHVGDMRSGPLRIESRGLEHDIRERLKALDFLKRASDGKHRIVSSGDLTAHQIAEAQANGKFFVEPGGGLGWALLPWELTTDKDQMRAGLACASDPKP